MDLSADQYAKLSELLERHAGIRLGAGKEYLVLSRLGGLISHLGLDGFEGLLRRLQGGGDRLLLTHVIDAMTTNETFWFRDPAHYQILTRDVLPALESRQARIWSAAASTGQEAYSIAMSIRSAVSARQLPMDFSFEILGTDISEKALQQAESGRYCGLAATRGLDHEQRQRYFSGDGDCIEVQPVFRRNVSFRNFNLLATYAALGRFDVIFCRNVLIYFSQERKRDIIERFHGALRPGGCLFLGSTESMNSHEDLFEMRRHGAGLAFYRR